MAEWRAARSLLVLRDQVDALYPRRARGSDGLIGDDAHKAQGSASEHNPDAQGIVRALDLTNDTPYFDSTGLASLLVASRDVRIRYVIANHRICSGYNGVDPWKWRDYTGTDPHTGHMHLSVVADDRADDLTPWNLWGASRAEGTFKEVNMLFVRNGASMVLTDWSTWCDPTISYDQVQAMHAAGVPQVDVSASQMSAVLALPMPHSLLNKVNGLTAVQLTSEDLDRIDQLARAVLDAASAGTPALTVEQVTGAVLEAFRRGTE